MKTVKVVAAIICDNIKEKNKIFATARGYGELKGGWEFPGGKVELGETPKQALVREIMEELDTEIKVGELEETVIATPIEYLLLETDGPYVKPERPDDVTGKKWAKARNTSLILPNIAEKIAELKGMMVKDVVRITEENTRRVFKLNNCASYSRYF